MVANGMRDAGYRYLNLDDCWQIDRDADGVIVVDPDRFPSGMAALAKYVHESGLLFGLYTCAGTMTCQERPGSYEYEYVDMQTYADWETDFVKVDWCFTDGLDSPERYAVFHDAIAATGREILLSICNWGYADPWVWGPLTGTIWRTSGDIFDHIAGVIINLTTDEPLAAFSSIGHWNDPDMLEVGNGGMTTEQYKAHFALWAILNSPLIAGNDLRDMNQDTRDILLNEELIAVNQDPNGLQGVIVSQKGNAKVYARPLTMDGLRAVVLFNGELENEATLEVKWSDLGLLPGPAEVRDLFAHQDLGPFEGSYSVTLAPTTAAAIRVQGTEALPVSGNHSLTEQTWKYEATPQGHIMRNQNAMGNPLTVAGTHYPAGLGAFGAMRLVIHLASRCTGLTAQVALDDAGGPEGSVTFSVVADGKILFDSGTMTIDSPSQDVQVNLTGKRELTLVVTPAGDSVSGDFANWLNPVLICK